MLPPDCVDTNDMFISLVHSSSELSSSPHFIFSVALLDLPFALRDRDPFVAWDVIADMPKFGGFSCFLLAIKLRSVRTTHLPSTATTGTRFPYLSASVVYAP